MPCITRAPTGNRGASSAHMALNSRRVAMAISSGSSSCWNPGWMAGQLRERRPHGHMRVPGGETTLRPWHRQASAGGGSPRAAGWIAGSGGTLGIAVTFETGRVRREVQLRLKPGGCTQAGNPSHLAAPPTWTANVLRQAVWARIAAGFSQPDQGAPRCHAAVLRAQNGGDRPLPPLIVAAGRWPDRDRATERGAPMTIRVLAIPGRSVVVRPRFFVAATGGEVTRSLYRRAIVRISLHHHIRFCYQMGC
jgi:hypothetical protein